MTIDFAPLEGITHYLYRSAHAAVFGPADRYFIPFISPRNCTFSNREMQDILPEHNRGLTVVPQLLTHEADCFLWAAGELQYMGYREVNLNLGCPSGTVVSKKKGAGLLGDFALLERFLTEIFLKCPLRISLKTRLGMGTPEKFDQLLALYNRFPVSELIVHPRIREDYYRAPVRMEYFEQALAQSRAPVVYNGDLFTAERLQAFESAYPQATHVMIGRGLLMHPALLNQYRGNRGETAEQLQAFHDLLYVGYQQLLHQETHVLCKMKEIWTYLGVGQKVPDKALKKLRKADSCKAYEEAVRLIFAELTRQEAAPAPAVQGE